MRSSSRVTLKYETLTLTLTLMFEHPPQPRIELHPLRFLVSVVVYLEIINLQRHRNPAIRILLRYLCVAVWHAPREACYLF